MPTYGDAKIKDMIESLLPSRARKTMRERKASVHRSQRRQANQRLDQHDVADKKRRQRINEIKWERRDADNVAAFCRWAVAVTKHISDPLDRYNYIKSLLPDNTIGRHALTHIDFLPEFKSPRRPEWYDRYVSPFSTEGKARAKHSKEEKIAGLVKALHEKLDDPKFHKALNRRMKETHVSSHYVGYKGSSSGYRKCDDCAAPRLLMGLHDIEDFVHDVYHSKHYDRIDVLKKFLDVE